ncbi:MAG: hypothetical protein DYG92_09640 [Leptolyngbya sp. PLA1]|nr:hypothetical protein [Leptolyngbya sp. PLA1]
MPSSTTNPAGASWNAASPPPFENGRQFRADADVAELDDKGRPGLAWAVTTTHLGRANLSISSRRLVYEGRVLVLAVHLLDATPTLLCGRVKSCTYAGESSHLIVMDLLPTPADETITRWLMGRVPQRRPA